MLYGAGMHAHMCIYAANAACVPTNKALEPGNEAISQSRDVFDIYTLH